MKRLLLIPLSFFLSNPQPANADEIQKLNGKQLNGAAQAMSEPSKAFESPPFSGSKILADDYVLVGQYKWGILFETNNIYKKAIDGKDYVFIPTTLAIDRDYLKGKEFLEFVNAEKPKGEMFQGGFLYYSGRYAKANNNIAITSLVSVPIDAETAANWPAISRGIAVHSMMQAANGALQLVIEAKNRGLVSDGEILNHSSETSATK